MEVGQVPAEGRREHARIGGRRPRMTEAQTRETALRTAVAAIREHGLPLGLEHLSMEDVIRDAEVSRTTFYRLWPQKDQFTGDLIVELAKEAIPTDNTEGAATTTLIKDLVLPRLEEMRDPGTRWHLVTDLLAAASAPDFEHTSALIGQWRTYFALIVMTMNLPDGEVRETARREIGNSEDVYRNRLVGNFSLLMRLFGIRLRTQAGTTLDDVADLLIAMNRGLVLRNRAATPSPSSGLVALGAIAIFTRYFENDPTVSWDDERIAQIEETLNTTSDLF
jgi:AcrR family transcriptional regulator